MASWKGSSERSYNDSTILTAWCVVFSVEAVVIMALNIYAIVFLIRGTFDRVRYFAVSFAFIDVMRGCVAIAIVLGLLRWDGIDCKVDYQELHLVLQTFCDVFSLCFLSAISCDMYCRIFSPITHMRIRARWYMSANFLIWIISMALTMLFAFGLAGFYQHVIADVLIWFIENICLTVICTIYILILRNARFNNRWRVGKRNFIYAKAFSLCAIIYLVIWIPVEVLEGTSHFTKSLSFPCNGLFFMKFLKIFCSFVGPVIYMKDFSRFHKSCQCQCTRIRRREKSMYLPDSLPLITLRSASHLLY